MPSKDPLTRALGLCSLGLATVQIAAPDALARSVGARPDGDVATVMRALGAREALCGVGILGRSRPVGWMWARVAGDAIDLALLGNALSSRRGDRDRLRAATAAVAGITVADLVVAVRLARSSGGDGMVHGQACITIRRPVDEVYRFWRDLENLPRFMAHLERVESTGGNRSRWRAAAPAGRSVEWEAEIVADRPGERIAWRSVEGAGLANRGEVRFRPSPGDRGTDLAVEMEYRAPAGRAGRLVARALGEEPEQQMRDDLRRLKQVLETGEVVRSDASPAGVRALDQAKQRPAQPPTGELVGGSRR